MEEERGLEGVEVKKDGLNTIESADGVFTFMSEKQFWGHK